MDHQVTVNEMEEMLKDCGMYEENMTKPEIESYYKAITDSKDTATIESENRHANTRNTSKVDTKNINTNEVDLNEVQDATKANIGFREMQNSSEESLEIINHEVLCENIQNSKKFLNADIITRTKMLYNYHTKLSKQRTELYRQSFFRAPLSKPIVIAEINESCMEFENGVTYISRSGRQTKRKTYIEEDDSSLDSFYNKKPKQVEPEWQSKSKPINKVNKIADLLNSNVPKQSEIKGADTNKPIITKTKKPSIAEIMEKSSLFSDSPKIKKQTKSDIFSNSPKRPIRRCEEIFDKLKVETEKKQIEENIVEAFKDSLVGSDEEPQSRKEKTEDIISINDEEPIRRRVIPPVPVRKRPVANRSRQISSVNNGDSNIQDSPTSSNKPFNQRIGKRPLIHNESVSLQDDVSTDTVPCPICGSFFSKEEISVHASTCGEEADQLSIYSTIPNLTCNICETFCPENYEEHLKECINRNTELIKKN